MSVDCASAVRPLRRDAAELARICGFVNAAKARGWTEARALRVFSRRHSGKVLRHGSRLQLSERTLRRHLRAFEQVGSAEAFPDRYVRVTGVSPTLRRAVLAAVLRPEVVSISQAVRLARQELKVSDRTAGRVLTARERQALRAVYRARIAVGRAERLARLALKGARSQ